MKIPPVLNPIVTRTDRGVLLPRLMKMRWSTGLVQSLQILMTVYPSFFLIWLVSCYVIVSVVCTSTPIPSSYGTGRNFGAGRALSPTDGHVLKSIILLFCA